MTRWTSCYGSVRAGWAIIRSRELISTRYLKRQRSLVREALDRLSDDGRTAAEVATERGLQDEERLETPLRLGEQRVQAVLAALREAGATSVLDLGCGEGNLLRVLLMEPAFRAITGVDVSHRALATAHFRLHLDDLPTAQRERITLLQGSLTYQDQRLDGYDAAVAMEVMSTSTRTGWKRSKPSCSEGRSPAR